MDRTLTILSIVLLIIIGLSVTVFYTSPVSTPSDIMTPLPIKGVCSVNGYVVDPHGNCIPNVTVVLHVIRSNTDSWDYELFNMTTTTNRVPSLVGFFTFDNIFVTPCYDLHFYRL